MSGAFEQHEQLPELSSDDRRLLDALVDVGFDPQALEPLSDVDRRRVQRLMSMFQLMRDYPVEDADDTLVDATLTRINRYEQQRAARMRFDAEEAVEVSSADGKGRRRLLRVPMPDFITVAAMLLIVAGISWPLLSHIRQESIKQTCADNLRQLNMAFSNYAADYNGALPTALAGMHNSWNVLAHNVINLSPLLEQDYCELKHLNCPGHDGEVGASYSYQWQTPGTTMHWNVGRTSVVLGDRNPLIDAVRRGRFAPPLTMSLNHGGHGQNVLWTDGSIVWLDDEPVVARDDNIWLPAGVEQLDETTPANDPADTFLAH